MPKSYLLLNQINNSINVILVHAENPTVAIEKAKIDAPRCNIIAWTINHETVHSFNIVIGRSEDFRKVQKVEQLTPTEERYSLRGN
jgi:hypothetical protein